MDSFTGFRRLQRLVREARRRGRLSAEDVAASVRAIESIDFDGARVEQDLSRPTLGPKRSSRYIKAIPHALGAEDLESADDPQTVERLRVAAWFDAECLRLGYAKGADILDVLAQAIIVALAKREMLRSGALRYYRGEVETVISEALASAFSEAGPSALTELAAEALRLRGIAS